MAKLTPTILVVDDDASSRSMLAEILSTAGYAILEASDGKEAMKILNKKPVDVVITDRAMPNMDGMALLEEIQAVQPTVPVFMVSAYGEESMWGQAIGRGAVDYLLKPFEPEDVLAKIRKSLSPRPRT